MEIYLSETWSTISDTEWTTSDARVMCRQLNHGSAGKTANHVILVMIIVVYFTCKIDNGNVKTTWRNFALTTSKALLIQALK